MAGSSLQRTLVIGRKEFLHILRDSQTLFFTLFVPVMELFMLGYAIDTNVRHIRTVVLDQAGTQESRQLVEKFENSTDFNVVQKVYSEREVSQAIVSGKARVGIVIPSDYSRKLLSGQTAQILISVDGTESSVAGEAINVGNALALRESLELALGGKPLPIEARPRVLFNPDTRSANFFIPGLMVVMCQMMATMLAANALVREKELGTLEQLYMTPVRRHELILGKMFPYIFLTVFEFCFIAFLMRVIFDVPINGSFMILLSLALPFILTMLGTGLLISTKADTREAAGQMVMGTVLPSIFLSGYVFPFDSMPLPFQILGNIFPTSWLIDASRTVILRGGGWESLWPHTIFLWSMAVVLIILGSLRIQKRLS
jgi:ABC-2 type transport system permease protein